MYDNLALKRYLCGLGAVAGILLTGSPTFAGRVKFAVVQDQTYVDLRQATCLIVDPTRVMLKQKLFDAERVSKVLASQFPQKSISVSKDRQNCGWVFYINIVSRSDLAITYQGRAARYLLSVGVCDWALSNGAPSPNTCLAKSVYVFDENVPIDDLLKAAVISLSVKQDNNSWKFLEEVFTNA